MLQVPPPRSTAQRESPRFHGTSCTTTLLVLLWCAISQCDINQWLLVNCETFHPLIFYRFGGCRNASPNPRVLPLPGFMIELSTDFRSHS
ncbi:hypothetical protein BJY00DRAFT_123866 [Aspergillus carlsbadensis]|nr:hypothetical protein BJY00DRAFT_123866 [Aspergillus carlsbadensis]